MLLINKLFNFLPFSSRPQWRSPGRCVAWMLGLASMSGAWAADFPAIELATVVAGLRAPVHLTHAAEGTTHLYVVEQAGRVWVVDGDRLRPRAFLDIAERVASGGEKGLLSIAFHPRHADNGYVFVNYTTERGKLVSRISRFTRAAADRLDPDSEKIILEVDQPYGNHNGGQLAFGPDGYLYIGFGDGGSANDPRGHGQNPNTLLGAILRIDVDKTDPGLAYAVPADNPFRARRGFRPEIWAYGLRNPWRFSFDAATGTLYAADVGQDDREEIDVIEKGANYGWNIMEGDICTPAVARSCRREGLRLPIHTYSHREGRSVTGGFVYRGKAIPDLVGAYLFADYVSGHIWALRYRDGRVTAQARLVANSGRFISSFGEGPDGELYVLDHRAGEIVKIVARRKVQAPAESRTP